MSQEHASSLPPTSSYSPRAAPCPQAGQTSIVIHTSLVQLIYNYPRLYLPLYLYTPPSSAQTPTTSSSLAVYKGLCPKIAAIQIPICLSRAVSSKGLLEQRHTTLLCQQKGYAFPPPYLPPPPPPYLPPPSPPPPLLYINHRHLQVLYIPLLILPTHHLLLQE